MTDLSPFNKLGKVRSDLAAIDVSSLDPVRLQCWNNLIAAARECEEAETVTTTKHDAIAEAVRVLNTARELLPKITRHDLWLHEVKGVPLPS